MDSKQALRQLCNKAFLATPKYREQQGRPDRRGAHPRILEFEKALIMDLRRRGIPMFPHEIVRSKWRQQELYVKGYSKAQSGESPHQYGMAVDIVHSLYGWKIAHPSWLIVGHCGKEVAKRLGIAIEWGGDWDFYDPAHWQLKGWKSQIADFPDWNGYHTSQSLTA